MILFQSSTVFRRSSGIYGIVTHWCPIALASANALTESFSRMSSPMWLDGEVSPFCLSSARIWAGVLAEVSGEFDFLVPDLRDLAKRARKIRFHQVANRVKLETDFF